MSDQENSAGSWWGDMADAFKESVKSLISSGTERLNKEIVGQGDVSDYPRQQLENDYYDDEHMGQYDSHRTNRRAKGEYQGFVFNNIPMIYVGGGLLLLVLLLRK